MKTEITETGWREITTVSINVTQECSKPFMSVEKWIESNERLNTFKKRSKCSCCKTSWDKLTGYMFLVFTNKGNKFVCGGCVVKFTPLKQNEGL